MKKICEVAVTDLEGAITTVALETETQHTTSLLVGTQSCNIYRVRWEAKNLRWVEIAWGA